MKSEELRKTLAYSNIWRCEMNKKIEGSVFLVLTAVVTLISTLLTIWWHLDKLPDPINVISILALSFGPLTIMFTYFIYKYKD
jgi:hypothetical protein